MKLKKQEFSTALVEEMLSKYNAKGISIALIQNGEITALHTQGIKNTCGDSVEHSTLFEAASLTKTIFANLALKLCAQGIFSLDTPLIPLLSCSVTDDCRGDDVTLRHCLSHGTGFPNWSEKPMPMAFDPGSSYSYSGEGYFLAQHVAESLTGKSFTTLAREYVLSPFGMNNSTVVWDSNVGNAIAQGFDGDGSLVKTRDCIDDDGITPEPNAAWSLYTTAEDYGKFLCNMYKGGGIEPQLLEQATTQQNNAGNSVLWGLGFGIPEKDKNVIWHWGDNSGFESFAMIDLKTGDGGAIFTNSDKGNALCLDLFEHITDGEFFEDIRNFLKTAE